MGGQPDYAELIRVALGEPAAPEEQSPTDIRILDAVLELVGEYGERLTIDDIASRAKVARKTIFRRFGSKEALLAQVYSREVQRAVELVYAGAQTGDDAAGAVAAAYTRLAEYVAAHPVIRRLARAEPETLVALWRAGSPSGFEMTRTLLMAAAGQAERGAVPMDRLELACDLLCRQLLARQLLPLEELSAPVAANEPALVREIVNAVLALGAVSDTSSR